jgi:hypothetical protein
VLPQWCGIVGLLSMLGFYFATGQTNSALLVAFSGLIVVGQGAEAVGSLRTSKPRTDPEQETEEAASNR